MYMIDVNGNYLGEFLGVAQKDMPDGCISVPIAPNDSRDKFINGEWIPFVNPPPTPAEQLAETDAGMIRMIEDIAAVLITKGLILETDLPVEAQAKLNNRKALRAQL